MPAEKRPSSQKVLDLMADSLSPHRTALPTATGSGSGNGSGRGSSLSPSIVSPLDHREQTQRRTTSDSMGQTQSGSNSRIVSSRSESGIMMMHKAKSERNFYIREELTTMTTMTHQDHQAYIHQRMNNLVSGGVNDGDSSKGQGTLVHQNSRTHQEFGNDSWDPQRNKRTQTDSFRELNKELNLGENRYPPAKETSQSPHSTYRSSTSAASSRNTLIIKAQSERNLFSTSNHWIPSNPDGIQWDPLDTTQAAQSDRHLVVPLDDLLDIVKNSDRNPTRRDRYETPSSNRHGSSRSRSREKKKKKNEQSPVRRAKSERHLFASKSDDLMDLMPHQHPHPHQHPRPPSGPSRSKSPRRVPPRAQSERHLLVANHHQGRDQSGSSKSPVPARRSRSNGRRSTSHDTRRRLATSDQHVWGSGSTTTTTDRTTSPPLPLRSSSLPRRHPSSKSPDPKSRSHSRGRPRSSRNRNERTVVQHMDQSGDCNLPMVEIRCCESSRRGSKSPAAPGRRPGSTGSRSLSRPRRRESQEYDVMDRAAPRFDDEPDRSSPKRRTSGSSKSSPQSPKPKPRESMDQDAAAFPPLPEPQNFIEVPLALAPAPVGRFSPSPRTSTSRSAHWRAERSSVRSDDSKFVGHEDSCSSFVLDEEKEENARDYHCSKSNGLDAKSAGGRKRSKEAAEEESLSTKAKQAEDRRASRRSSHEMVASSSHSEGNGRRSRRSDAPVTASSNHSNGGGGRRARRSEAHISASSSHSSGDPPRTRSSSRSKSKERRSRRSDALISGSSSHSDGGRRPRSSQRSLSADSKRGWKSLQRLASGSSNDDSFGSNKSTPTRRGRKSELVGSTDVDNEDTFGDSFASSKSKPRRGRKSELLGASDVVDNEDSFGERSFAEFPPSKPRRGKKSDLWGTATSNAGKADNERGRKQHENHERSMRSKSRDRTSNSRSTERRKSTDDNSVGGKVTRRRQREMDKSGTIIQKWARRYLAQKTRVQLSSSMELRQAHREESTQKDNVLCVVEDEQPHSNDARLGDNRRGVEDQQEHVQNGDTSSTPDVQPPTEPGEASVATSASNNQSREDASASLAIRKEQAPTTPDCPQVDLQHDACIMIQKRIRGYLAKAFVQTALRQRAEAWQCDLAKYHSEQERYLLYRKERREDLRRLKQELVVVEEQIAHVEDAMEKEQWERIESMDVQKKIWGQVIRKRVAQDQAKLQDESSSLPQQQAGLDQWAPLDPDLSPVEQIAALEEEIVLMKDWIQKTDSKLVSKRAEGKELEVANASVEKMFHELNEFAKKKVSEKKELSSQQLMLTKMLLPKALGQCQMATVEAQHEVRLRTMYRRALYRVLEGVQTTHAYDHELYEDALHAIQECESALNENVLEDDQLQKMVLGDLDALIEVGLSRLNELGPVPSVAVGSSGWDVVAKGVLSNLGKKGKLTWDDLQQGASEKHGGMPAL